MSIPDVTEVVLARRSGPDFSSQLVPRNVRPAAKRRRRVHATFLAPAALGWLQDEGEASILNVFDRACNLIRGDGSVVSLVSRPGEFGPFSVVLDDSVSNGRDSTNLVSHVDARSEVRVGPSSLVLGGLEVAYSAARLRSARPDWESLAIRGVRCCLDALQPVLALPGAIDEPLTREQNVAWHQVLGRSWRLMQAGLSEEDADLCREAAATLAGVGAGLTPAGDDFLLGVLTALWATVMVHQTEALIDAIVCASMSRTTPLSAAWLKAAGRGEVGASWLELVERTACMDKTGIVRAAHVILRTGHSSGRYALFGFKRTLRLILAPGGA